MTTSLPGANAIAVLEAFVAAWNRHEIAEVLHFFADDAVVQLMPGPSGAPETFAGREQIRTFVDRFVAGGHLEADNLEATGNRVIWNARIMVDPFRQQGLELTNGTGDMELAGRQIQRLTLTLDAEMVGQL